MNMGSSRVDRSSHVVGPAVPGFDHLDVHDHPPRPGLHPAVHNHPVHLPPDSVHRCCTRINTSYLIACLTYLKINKYECTMDQEL